MKSHASINRSNRTPALETLEGRSLFAAAALDTAFRGGAVQTRFGGTAEYATAATVLSSGKLLVSGGTGMADGLHNAFALYNKDGTLSNGFDGDGKLVLTQAQYEQLGVAQKLVATPDGGAIMQGFYGIAKITAAGKLDTTFGYYKTGIVSYGSPNNVADVRVTNDGHVRLLIDINSANGTPTGTDIVRLDANGIPEQTANRINYVGPTRFLADGSAATVRSDRSGEYTVYGLTSDLTRQPGFGDNGIAYVNPAYTKFLAANGPFTSAPAQLDNKGNPQLLMSPAVRTADGGLLIYASIGGVSTKLASADGYTTNVFITIDKTGKNITFHALPNTGTGTYVTFAGKPNGASPDGKIYLPTGSPLDIDLFNSTSTLASSYTAADGSIYVVGSVPLGSYSTAFAVGKLKPISAAVPATGSISGILFNDDNADEVQQANEILNTGRVVYIDANNNGKADNNELQTTTDANGRYTFSNLAPGNYAVRRVLPNGYQITSANARPGLGDVTAVVAGVTTTQDIGSTTRGIIYGHVYYADKSGNPVTPIAGQTVFFDVNKNGKLDAGEYSDVSDASGYYVIAAPGRSDGYRITSIPPAGYKVYDFFGQNYFDGAVNVADRSQLNFGFVPIA